MDELPEDSGEGLPASGSSGTSFKTLCCEIRVPGRSIAPFRDSATALSGLSSGADVKVAVSNTRRKSFPVVMVSSLIVSNVFRPEFAVIAKTNPVATVPQPTHDRSWQKRHPTCSQTKLCACAKYVTDRIDAF